MPDAEEERGGEGPKPSRIRAEPLPRTAKQVIDQAIKDNKWNGNLLFGMLTLFALAGLVALGVRVWQQEGTVALAGGLSSILLWPTITHAREIRRENIALRMLEYPLSMASSSKEASEALKEFFIETFIKRPAKSGE